MILKLIEDVIFGGREECRFQKDRNSHLLLLPGMLGPVSWLFPLTRYLRQNQPGFGVTAIPLGQTNGTLEQVVTWAETRIVRGIGSSPPPEEIALFGHSYGGRVACVLFEMLSPKFPRTKFKVITAGTPIVRKPSDLPIIKTVFYDLFSPAFKEWPDITQPQISSRNLEDYTGFYSDDDAVVSPRIAKEGHEGRMTRLEGFSHKDMFRPDKMGPVLLDYLTD